MQHHHDDRDREQGFRMIAYMRRRFHKKARLIQYHARLKLCKDYYLRREQERKLVRDQVEKGTKMLAIEFMRLKMLTQIS